MLKKNDFVTLAQLTTALLSTHCVRSNLSNLLKSKNISTVKIKSDVCKIRHFLRYTVASCNIFI